jgi:two-component system sensor histidine kinase YesM
MPIIIITTFTYNRYTSLVKEQTAQITENIFEKASDQINSAIGNINHIAEIFSFYSESRDSIIEDLKKYTHQNGYSNYDIFKSNQNIKFICQNLIYSSEYINGIFFFTPYGEVLGYGNNIDITYDYIPFEDKWYKETINLKGKIYIDGLSAKSFIINSRPSISFSRAIYDVYSHEFLGVLLVDCSPSVFDLSKVNTLPDTAMLAIENTSTHCILYSNADNIKNLSSLKNMKVMKKNLNIKELTLTAAINYEQIYNEFGFTRILILIIAGVCALIFIVISALLSFSLTKPIIHLSKKMATRGGVLSLSGKYLERKDEIGTLYNEYNSMVKEINNFIKNEYQNKLIILDSQMKSLEAQINSHFLFNTLESINSIAEIEGNQSIAVMSLALGNMFRYSIKTKSELVTITDEINHVKDYISIQTIRFDGKINLILNIKEEYLNLKILKLILQPLVENALYHGLKNCTCGQTIKISASLNDDCIYLSVEDDGIGMPEEKLIQIREKLEKEPHFTELGHRNNQSIGLKNIHSRIELYYGKGYGLSVESLEGKGTKINIKLPVLNEKEE